MGNFVNISFNMGLIITYLLSTVVTWRVLTWLAIIPPTLTILMMMILPETPYWLAEKNRSEEALDSLAWLRNNDESQDEVKEIKEKSKSENNDSMFEKISSKLDGDYRNAVSIVIRHCVALFLSCCKSSGPIYQKKTLSRRK